VRPGAVPWLGDLEFYHSRWHELGRRAQIVGPHGSGKSTLLAHLVARAQRDGIVVAALDDATVRSPLRVLYARARHRQLLVTAHHDLGLPTLCHLRVDLANTRAVVAHLLREYPAYAPSDAALTALLVTHAGNLREVLFALYDRYEAGAFAPLSA
jgi:RecA/RadA recombinase